MSTHYFRFTARGTGTATRSPLIETLVARADELAPTDQWRSLAFDVIAPQTAMPGVGAAALYAKHGAVAGAWVWVATPLRYAAEMSNVRLPADGILVLAEAECALLVADFNRIWRDAGLRLLPGASATLLMIAERPHALITHEPEEVLDRHIDSFLPSGPDAPHVRRLMSEIEMWLFEHEVNRTRAARGLSPISGLWLWGGGAVQSTLPSANGWTAGRDVFFESFTPRREIAGGAGSGVVVLDGEPGSEEGERAQTRWLMPSLLELRERRIETMVLSAGTHSWRLGPRSLWRLWRRARPWWESFA